MPPVKSKITTSQIFRAFWDGLKPHAGLFFLSLALISGAQVIITIVPLYYKDFFDTIETAVTKDELVVSSLVGIVVVILVVHIFQWAMYRSGIFIISFVDSRVMARLRQNAFNQLIFHSHSFFADNFTGSFVQKINRFSRAFEGISDTVAFQILPLAITVTVSVVVTYTFTPIISLIICFWVVFFVVVNLTYSRFMVKYRVASAAADSKTGAILADSLSNHASVMNFTGYEHEQQSFYATTQDQAKKVNKSWNMSEYASTFQALMLFVVEFFVFYFAIKYWQANSITVGTFVLIQIYVIGVANQLWMLSRITRTFYEALADSREMVEIMLQPYEIVDVPNAKELSVTQAQIELENVSFLYKNTSKGVLNDVTFTIAPGEKIALIGPSGAGKTTLTRLILRQHNISSGKILIDGQDISQITQNSLRQNISLVPQDTVLFHRTLLDNIKYGRRDATDEEAIEAAKLAHCDEFINILPNKYETFVGERGVKLSGGERQRIAIARAILKNAPILILDEATSSLDSHSESMIQKALDNLMEGRTTIVIAHRLSTIKKMDRIIVMEHGSVREQGTHSELIEKQGSLYKKLWDLQVGGFISVPEE